MSVAYLSRYKLIYLASAYTKHPNRHRAWVDACRVTAKLMKAGLYVVSPIVHSHAVAEWGGLNALDHAFWLDQDRPLQDACDAMVILKSDGWQDSDGIKAEIAHAALRGQPVYGLDPETLTLTKWGHE